MASPQSASRIKKILWLSNSDAKSELLWRTVEHKILLLFPKIRKVHKSKHGAVRLCELGRKNKRKSFQLNAHFAEWMNECTSKQLSESRSLLNGPVEFTQGRRLLSKYIMAASEWHVPWMNESYAFLAWNSRDNLEKYLANHPLRIRSFRENCCP